MILNYQIFTLLYVEYFANLLNSNLFKISWYFNFSRVFNNHPSGSGPSASHPIAI